MKEEKIFEIQEARQFLESQEKNILKLKIKNPSGQGTKELIFFKENTSVKELNEFQEKNKNIFTQDIYNQKEKINSDDFIKIERKKNGEIKLVKVEITKLAKYLIDKYIFKTIYGTKSESIFVFLDGIYQNNGREIIETNIEKILGTHCTNHHVKEIVEKIKRLTAISRDNFDKTPERLICLKNGLLNIKTLILEKHNPKYYFKRKLPLNYKKDSNCPNIINFLKTCLYEDDLKTIQEWFGFNLYRRYFLKKAVILFGKTDTGKTVFLNLLSKWIGDDNISGLSLQRISSGDKFGLASLKDKHANIFDDLTTEDMISGGFKISTGGGSITAEFKFGDSFTFKSFAKLIFAGNKIPSLKEIDAEDSAYYRDRKSVV